MELLEQENNSYPRLLSQSDLPGATANSGQDVGLVRQTHLGSFLGGDTKPPETNTTQGFQSINNKKREFGTVGLHTSNRTSPDLDNCNLSDADEVHTDPVDVAVAFNFIMRKYDSAIKELTQNTTHENYKILSKYCIADIKIVNGRHPEEVTHALLTHYQMRRSLNELPEELRSLLISEEELKQVGCLEFFYVPGKTLKVVPCLLTKNMKMAVEILLKSRSILKINREYLFPKPTQFGNCSLFSGTQIINELSSILKDYLGNPKSFTAIGVLNYVQTSSQMMDVGLVRRTYFSTFLGGVTKPSETNTIQGFQSKSNQKRKFDTVLAINRHGSFPVKKRTKVSKMSEESSDSDSNLPSLKTPISRVRWTDEEKEVLYKHFGKQLLELRQPPRRDIRDIGEMEPALRNRTLNQVCSYINNIVTQKTELPPSVVQQLRQSYS